ncbi:hypothetical protein QE396_002938 [Enterobacter sp. SORGH_AS 287]|nr:hypothetical protein [Enterobacter sp. SORGH_AS_0287]
MMKTSVRRRWILSFRAALAHFYSDRGNSFSPDGKDDLETGLTERASYA